MSRRFLGSVPLVLLLALQGCWPGIPILAAIAAASSGGSSSSGLPFTIKGSVILAPTSTTSIPADLDHEPNDWLGMAGSLGVVRPGEARIFQGTSACSLLLRSLVETRSGLQVEEWDLLPGSRRMRRLNGRGVTPSRARFIARGPNTFYALEEDPSGPLRSRIQVLGRGVGLEQQSLELQTTGPVLGMAHGFDLLLLLIEAGEATRSLGLFDPATSELLLEVPLEAGGLEGLAAGFDPIAGRDRVFSYDPAAGAIVEIPFARDGQDWRAGAAVAFAAHSTPSAPALAFDGVFVHAGSDATWSSFAAADGELIATTPRASEGVLLDACATLDFGRDGYRLLVPAGESVELQLVHPRGSADAPQRWFFAAIDVERTLTQSRPELAHFELCANGRSEVLRLSADRSARCFELIVGNLMGGGDYQIQGQNRRSAPHLAASTPAAPSPLRTRLHTVVRSLDERHLIGPYCEPRLAAHEAGRIVLAEVPGSMRLALPHGGQVVNLKEERVTSRGVCIARFAFTTRPVLEDTPRVHGRLAGAARQRGADREMLCALAAVEMTGGVRWCEPVYRLRTLSTTPNDPFYPNQTWHYDLMRCDQAWDSTQGSTSIHVAVIDSGIRTENPDLAPGAGFDFVSSLGNSGDGDGIDANPFDPSGPESHGTHVGGTVSAVGDNNVLVTGVMWNSTLHPLRAVGDDGFGSTVDIAEAILFAARVANVSGTLPAQVMDVINLSLGSSAPSNLMLDAIRQAVAKDVVVVAASGNDGVPGVLFPAAFAEVIAVGAATIVEGLAGYSNTGAEIDVVAPGGENTDVDMNGDPDMILSTSGSPLDLTFQAGTSMACAHVSGLAGLLRTLNDTLGPEDVRSLLRTTAKDLGATGFDPQFGAGLINAFAAVSSAPAVLGVSGTAVDFGANGGRLLIQINNGGAGDLQISSFNLTPITGGSTAWITPTLTAPDLDLFLLADRSVVGVGSFEVQLDIISNGGTIPLTVLMTKSLAPLPDVGEVVLETRGTGGALLGRTTTTLADSYQFVLPTAAGLVNVFLGIDLDANGVICEPGEPCGRYPSVAEATPLSVKRDIEMDLLLE